MLGLDDGVGFEDADLEVEPAPARTCRNCRHAYTWDAVEQEPCRVGMLFCGEGFEQVPEAGHCPMWNLHPEDWQARKRARRRMA